MLAAEPNASKYDLHFSVGRIPVRIHPMFWLVTGVFGLLGGNPTVLSVVLWIAAVFISILVHELGHAVVAKAHGWPPAITLYGMGGVATYRPTRSTTKSQLLIAFAGPGAGFVLGALVLTGVLVSGHAVTLPGMGIAIGDGPLLFGGGRLELFVTYLLWVNFFWGLINLAPIQPLDGGTIAAAVLSHQNPRTGLVRSLKLSVGVAAALAVGSLVFYANPFLVIMFAMLGYNNWHLLSQVQSGR